MLRLPFSTQYEPVPLPWIGIDEKSSVFREIAKLGDSSLRFGREADHVADGSTTIIGVAEDLAKGMIFAVSRIIETFCLSGTIR